MKSSKFLGVFPTLFLSLFCTLAICSCGSEEDEEEGWDIKFGDPLPIDTLIEFAPAPYVEQTTQQNAINWPAE